MSYNISTRTMDILDAKSLFSSINKRHKKDIHCNMLLLKMIDSHGDHYYAIQEFDKLTSETIIRIPSEDEVDFLKNILFLDGRKICKYDIGGEYLKESFEFGDISFVLFSKSVDTRTRTTEAIVNVCGLLFLDVIERRNSTRDLYIKLICSEGRSESESVGLGSKFMTLAETIGKIIKCNKVVLSSVDTPLGFYLSKDYKPTYGKSFYEIPENIKIPIFKRGKLLQSSLSKKAHFLNSMGLSTSFRDATRLLPQTNNNRSLRRTTPRESAGRKYLGDGSIGGLSGVKLDIDNSSKMVFMEKILPRQSVTVAQGKKKLSKVKRSKKSHKSQNKNRKRRSYKKKSSSSSSKN